MIETYGGLVTMIIIAGAILYLLLSSTKKKQDPWEQLASSLGMDYEERNFRRGMLSAQVSGDYRDRPLLLNTVRSGTEIQTLYTQIRVAVENPDENSLSLTNRNIFTEAVRRLGVPYTSIGDDEFDQRFVVLARPEELAKKLLGSPYLRQRLLRAKKLDIQLSGDYLIFRMRGFVTNIEILKELIDLIYEVADRVEKTTQTAPATSFSLN